MIYVEKTYGDELKVSLCLQHQFTQPFTNNLALESRFLQYSPLFHGFVLFTLQRVNIWHSTANTSRHHLMHQKINCAPQAAALGRISCGRNTTAAAAAVLEREAVTAKWPSVRPSCNVPRYVHFLCDPFLLRKRR